MGSTMKNSGKFVLSILSVIMLTSLTFWGALYYIGGLSYDYHGAGVTLAAWIFSIIAALCYLGLALFIALLFKDGVNKLLRSAVTVLLALFIPLAAYGSLIGIAVNMIMGPYGCDYTEDIADYEKVKNDRGSYVEHFPDAITEDMTVVSFSYYYKYVDTSQNDIYLEVKFNDKATMEKYLSDSMNKIAGQETASYPNPYSSAYTDVALSSAAITFGCFDDSGYRYVDMNYRAISYSYDELTIIYNSTVLGSDIEWGNRPDRGEYRSKYLQRFGVECIAENNFKIKISDSEAT